MHQLLMTDEKISNVHVSIRSSNLCVDDECEELDMRHVQLDRASS